MISRVRATLPLQRFYTVSRGLFTVKHLVETVEKLS